jgi:hypothetical protein
MNIHSNTLTKLSNRILMLASLLAIIIFIIPNDTLSQTYANPAPVPLLTVGTYGIIASTGITGSANVSGDIGTVSGTIDVTVIPSGTNWGVGDSHTSTAQNDLLAALVNANGRTNDAVIPDALAGQTLQRGVYQGGALDLAASATLTLDAMGDPNAVFIIKASSTLTMNSNSIISLINGAVWSNIFWYVGSSSTTISGSSFSGIILAVTSITVNAGATSITAKLLANGGAVTINSDVLPVELLSFTAATKNNVVELNWETATEVNNYGFEIERSVIVNQQSNESVKLNAGNWKKIGFVQGEGNSNSPKQYIFRDTPNDGVKFGYRLKQIDYDGSFEYSNEIEVNIDSPAKLSLNQNYPNPFNPNTSIIFEVPVKSNISIKVYNVIGSMIAVLLNEEKLPGRYQVEFNASDLASGIYFYSINAGNYKPIIKKMILLK